MSHIIAPRRSLILPRRVRQQQGGFIMNPFAHGSTPPPAPTDPLFAYVASLLHCNGVHLSASFPDVKGLTWSPYLLGPVVSTAHSKLGGASIRFGGSNDCMTTLRSNIQFGSGDFVIEGSCYLIAHTNTQPCIFSNYDSFGSGSLSLFAGHQASNTTRFQVACNGVFPAIQSTSTIPYNTWFDWCIERVSGVITLYINGVSEGSYSTSAALNGSGSNFCLGASPDNLSATYLDGYMDEFRATVGTHRYAGNYTPATAEFPDI